MGVGLRHSGPGVCVVRPGRPALRHPALPGGLAASCRTWSADAPPPRATAAPSSRAQTDTI